MSLSSWNSTHVKFEIYKEFFIKMIIFYHQSMILNLYVNWIWHQSVFNLYWSWPTIFLSFLRCRYSYYYFTQICKNLIFLSFTFSDISYLMDAKNEIERKKDNPNHQNADDESNHVSWIWFRKPLKTKNWFNEIS